jgi:GntR family transcriptional regulator
MLLRLEPSGREPLYQQLARQLRQRISGGQWQAGEQLPSARELSAELGINFLTVTKVYGMLEQEGLVEMRRGLGTFVARRSDASQIAERRRLLDQLIDELLSGAGQLGLNGREVLRRVKEKIEEDNQ